VSTIDLDEAANHLARRSREFWFAQAARRGLDINAVVVRWKFCHRSVGRSTSIPTVGHVADLVPAGRSDDTDRLIFLGRPGAGAGAALLQLMSATLMEHETAAGEPAPIPVWVSLDDWQHSEVSVEDVILPAMLPLLPGRRLRRRWQLAQALLRTGRVRPFLDGTELSAAGDVEGVLRALGEQLDTWTVITRDDLRPRRDVWEALDATVVELLPVQPDAAHRYLVGRGIDPTEAPWSALLHLMADPTTLIAGTMGEPGQLALAASMADAGLLLTAADEADLRRRLLTGLCDRVAAGSNGNPLLWLGLLANESGTRAHLSWWAGVRLPWLRVLAVRLGIAGLTLILVGIAAALWREGVDPRLLALEPPPPVRLALSSAGYVVTGTVVVLGFSAIARMTRRSPHRLRSSVDDAVTSWTGFGMLGWWSVLLPALVLTAVTAGWPPRVDVPDSLPPWVALLLVASVAFYRRLIPPARAVGWLTLAAFFFVFRSRGRIEFGRTPLAAIRAERYAALREGVLGAVVGGATALGTARALGGIQMELTMALVLLAAAPAALVGFYRHPAVQNELGVRTALPPRLGRPGFADLIGEAVRAGVLEEFPTGLRFRSPALQQHLAEQYRGDLPDPEAVQLRNLADEIAAQSALYWEHEIRDRDLVVPAPISIQPIDGNSATAVIPFDGAEIERRLDQIESGPERALYLRGERGSGRTSMLVVLLQSLLERRQSRSESARRTVPVPVYVSLSGWRPSDTSLVSWLKDRLSRDHPCLTVEQYGGDPAAALLDAGLLTVFVDDLDTESGAERLSRAERGSAVEQLDRLSARVRMVVVCAPTTVWHDRPGCLVLPVAPESVVAHLARGDDAAQGGRWQPIERHLCRHPTDVLTRVLIRPAGIGLARRAFRDGDPADLLTGTYSSTDAVMEDMVARCLAVAVTDPEERHRAEWWLRWVAARAGESRELAWCDVPRWLAKGPRHACQALLVAMGTAGIGISLSYSWPLVLGIMLVGGIAGFLLPLWRSDLVKPPQTIRSRPAVTSPRHEYQVGRRQFLLLTTFVLVAFVPVEHGIAMGGEMTASWPETAVGALLTCLASMLLIVPAAAFRIAALTSAIVHRRSFHYFRLMDGAGRAGLVHRAGAVHRFANTEVQQALARQTGVEAAPTRTREADHNNRSPVLQLVGRSGRALSIMRAYVSVDLGFAQAGPSPLDAEVDRAARRVAEVAGRDPRHARRWEEAGRALEERYQAADRLGDLRKARDAFRTAARATPWFHPDRARRLNLRARAVVGVYRHTGEGMDLDDAIKVVARLLEQLGRGESDYPPWSMELGQLLLESGLRGNPERLRAAVQRLQAAVDAVGENDVRRAPYLRALATGLENRSTYLRRNRVLIGNVQRLRVRLAGNDPAGSDDLDTAVALRMEALRLVETHQSDGTDRERYETELRVLRQYRYTRRARLDDLDAADPLLRPAADAGPGGVPTMAPSYRGVLVHPLQRTGFHYSMAEESEPGDPDRCAARLASRATTLLNRFDRSGSVEDLDAAVSALQSALGTAGPRYPWRPLHHTDLAGAHLCRYQHGGTDADLGAALDESNRALARPPEAGDQRWRPAALAVVVSALLLRYEAEPHLIYIEEAIRACSEQSSADSGDLLPVGLLGNARLMRHWHTGDLDDLADAVTALETAAERCAVAGVRAALLSNLACALLARHADGGLVRDIDAAMDAARLAVTRAPEAQARLWSNYGSTLLARYLVRRKGAGVGYGEDEQADENALDEALAGTDRAVALSLAGGRSADPGTLVQRAVALRVRFERDALLTDLSTAQETLRVLLDTLPAGHRQRSVALTELGNVTWLRHVRIRDVGARQEAILAWREAARLGPVHDRIVAARAWGRAAFQAGDIRQAVGGYEVAIKLLPELADPCLARAVRQRRLSRWSGLAAEAVTVAIAADLPERAVGLLEAGRAVLWNQDLRLRSELLRLRKRQPELTAALEAARSVLDAPTTEPQARRGARTAWDQALARVRALPEEQAFLLPTPGLPEPGPVANGTVVVLNASVLGCHAIVIRPPEQADDKRPEWARALGRHLPTGVQRRRLRQVWAAMTYLLLGLCYYAFRMYITGSRRDWTRLMQASLGARLRESKTGLTGFMAVSLLAFVLGLVWAPLLIVTALVGMGLMVVSMIAQERGVRRRSGSGWPARAVRRLGRLIDPAPVRVLALPQVTSAALVEQARRLDRATTVEDAEVEEVLEWLWTAVAEPVLTALGQHVQIPPEAGPPRIWWLPVGVFGGLPIHAAGYYRQSSSEIPDAGKCVPARVISSYLGTLSSLERGLATAVAHPRQLAVGVGDAQGQQPLRGVGRELENLKTFLPEPERATHLLDAAATKPAVLAELPRFPWLHLACHAVEDGLDPAGTGFALYGPQAQSRLTVAELAALPPVQGHLAYLAACGSATGALQLSDESVHLAAAMQMLGYPHVIATWWTIDESTSRQVAAAFYDSVLAADLTDPDAVARALHSAVEGVRLEAAATPRRARHWAAYVHLGP